MAMNRSLAHRKLVRAILAKYGAHPQLRLWEIQVCPVVNPRTGRRIGGMSAPTGHPDISGITATGRRIDLEVKTGTGRRSDPQEKFGDMLERFSGIYAVCRSVEDAGQALGLP